MHLLVRLAEDESVLRVSCPDQLDAQQADLSWERRLELQQLQARLADGQVGLPDDGVEGLPHTRQQLSQPHLHVPLPETDSSATAEAEGVKTHENHTKIHKNQQKVKLILQAAVQDISPGNHLETSHISTAIPYRSRKT